MRNSKYHYNIQKTYQIIVDLVFLRALICFGFIVVLLYGCFPDCSYYDDEDNFSKPRYPSEGDMIEEGDAPFVWFPNSTGDSVVGGGDVKIFISKVGDSTTLYQEKFNEGDNEFIAFFELFPGEYEWWLTSTLSGGDGCQGERTSDKIPFSVISSNETIDSGD